VNRRIICGLLASSLCVLGAGHAAAASIRIEGVYARATPAGASTGAAFMVIHNDGKADDTLVGASSPVAKTVQIHEMTTDDGIMHMRQVPGGLKVPAGGTVQLRPGSYHIMLIDLLQRLTSGKHFPITLKFQQAGDVPIEVTVHAMAGG
jgi:periplasmic copper chaperone A